MMRFKSLDDCSTLSPSLAHLGSEYIILFCKQQNFWPHLCEELESEDKLLCGFWRIQKNTDCIFRVCSTLFVVAQLENVQFNTFVERMWFDNLFQSIFHVSLGKISYMKVNMGVEDIHNVQRWGSWFSHWGLFKFPLCLKNLKWRTQIIFQGDNFGKNMLNFSRFSIIQMQKLGLFLLEVKLVTD